jgi:hypothetical protein
VQRQRRCVAAVVGAVALFAAAPPAQADSYGAWAGVVRLTTFTLPQSCGQIWDVCAYYDDTVYFAPQLPGTTTLWGGVGHYLRYEAGSYPSVDIDGNPVVCNAVLYEYGAGYVPFDAFGVGVSTDVWDSDSGPGTITIGFNSPSLPGKRYDYNSCLDPSLTIQDVAGGHTSTSFEAPDPGTTGTSGGLVKTIESTTFLVTYQLSRLAIPSHGAPLRTARQTAPSPTSPLAAPLIRRQESLFPGGQPSRCHSSVRRPAGGDGGTRALHATAFNEPAFVELKRVSLEKRVEAMGCLMAKQQRGFHAFNQR